MSDNRRLIEDSLPIEAISTDLPAACLRATNRQATHRGASRENGPHNKKQSLGRANAAKFVERLCKYPGNPSGQMGFGESKSGDRRPLSATRTAIFVTDSKYRIEGKVVPTAGFSYSSRKMY